ncbi:MAG: ROK family protein [Pseudanabaenaceae cyanobacterium]
MSSTILAIDVGGSGIKGMLVDELGQPQSDRLRLETPKPSQTAAVLATIEELARQLPGFGRVGIGFPGIVQGGITRGAVNLGAYWDDFPLAAVLAERLGVPVRVANDADVQGMAAIRGEGVELVLTLGTGLGSALFLAGRLVPNLELGQHPWRDNLRYEDWLGNAALERDGKKRWNIHLNRAIATLQPIFNFDRLYLGGGNAKHAEVTVEFPVEIVANRLGLIGCARLWR